MVNEVHPLLNKEVRPAPVGTGDPEVSLGSGLVTSGLQPGAEVEIFQNFPVLPGLKTPASESPGLNRAEPPSLVTPTGDGGTLINRPSFFRFLAGFGFSAKKIGESGTWNAVTLGRTAAMGDEGQGAGSPDRVENKSLPQSSGVIGTVGQFPDSSLVPPAENSPLLPEWWAQLTRNFEVKGFLIRPSGELEADLMDGGDVPPVLKIGLINTLEGLAA